MLVSCPVRGEEPVVVEALRMRLSPRVAVISSSSS
jgi:hypothetical protein